jgi:hypothetical protein
MPKKKTPKNPEQPSSPIDFKPIHTNGTYAVGLYVEGELDEIVFTLDKEPRDVTVRALCNSFALLFNLGLELGAKNEQARAYLASPEAQPTDEEAHVPDAA